MSLQSYRYYRLDEAGHLYDAEVIDAESDEEAIAKVEGKCAGALCEVWQGHRLVAKLSPKHLQA